MSSIYDKSGAGWNGINTDNCFKNYFKTREKGDMVKKENIYTTPKQFEEDHIKLMTVRFINVV